MRDTLLLVWAGPPRPGRADLARSTSFGRLAISWPADLPIKTNKLANGTCRLVIGREILPTNRSTHQPF